MNVLNNLKFVLLTIIITPLILINSILLTIRIFFDILITLINKPIIFINISIAKNELNELEENRNGTKRKNTK